MLPKVRHVYAPGFPDRLYTARHGDIREVGRSLEVLQISGKHFASPRLSVASKSRAIQRDADDLLRKLILRHAVCDMRMMMLNADETNVGVLLTLPLSPLCRAVRLKVATIFRVEHLCNASRARRNIGGRSAYGRSPYVCSRE